MFADQCRDVGALSDTFPAAMRHNLLVDPYREADETQCRSLELALRWALSPLEP